MRPFPCPWCDDPVLPGDLRHALTPGYHYACALRATLGSIGHIHKRCSCFVKDGTAEDDPPGLTKRQAARLVADHVRQQQVPTPGRN
jgi:hypothetical protein